LRIEIFENWGFGPNLKGQDWVEFGILFLLFVLSKESNFRVNSILTDLIPFYPTFYKN
jgi:hypothetical protein